MFTAALQQTQMKEFSKSHLDDFVISNIPETDFISGSSCEQIGIHVVPVKVVDVSIVRIFVTEEQVQR